MSAPATLTVPGDPPMSRNAADKLHWSARQKDRNWWQGEVGKAWLAAGRPTFPGAVRVAFRLWFARGTRRDPDNAGTKPLLDGLVACGCIRDDSSTFVRGYQVTMAVDKAAPRVEIEIEAV